MPIFEYTCRDCGHEFETLLCRAEDEPEKGCPACGSRELRRMLSTFSATVAKLSKTPCSTGACPSPSASHTCAGGSCPFS